MSTASQEDDKLKTTGSPCPPLGTGEGAETALQALIRKRQLRADDDTPIASDSTDSASPAAT